MRAVTWDGARVRVVDDAVDPQPAPGEAVVRVRLAGICSTDLEILAGYLGFRGVPGHEFVGDVVTGPADLVGRRVVGEINFACRRCAACAAGRERHCPARSVLGIVGADGAFAERLRIPAANLHVVPEQWPDEHAVFVEPLAAATEASLQSAAFAGGRTLVVGAGKLGLLVAQVLAARGDRVAVVARRQRARSIAADLGLDAAPEDVAPGTWDLVVDATGDRRGLEVAIRAVRPLGAIVLKSTVAEPYAIDLAPLVIGEITLVGSRCGPFPPALAALGEGRVRVAPLLEETFPLAEAPAAFRRAAEPGALKVLLDPSP
ncbi:MAG TPA: alcohol dehydrogenase catalytic domain-containing protein [Candidatus Binatia bacterium]|nr:alcohol dehydrogenase catalytic domain-containing protein [Candidatus Binatia bacterium]